MPLERVQADASITDCRTSSLHRRNVDRSRRTESVNGIFGVRASFFPAFSCTRHLNQSHPIRPASAAIGIRRVPGWDSLAGGCETPGAF
jgi:hypothetical protein